jgi:hypothetical protein
MQQNEVFDKCPVAYALLECSQVGNGLQGMYGFCFDTCILDPKCICRTTNSANDCIKAIKERIGEPVTVERMKEYEELNPSYKPKKKNDSQNS